MVETVEIESLRPALQELERADYRFWSKVDFVSQFPCWVWSGYITPKGYGQFGIRSGVMVKAHRFGYETQYGLVEPDLELDHICRNRACVNYTHLEVVTHAENCQRGIPGLRSLRRKRCPAGHLYAGSNIIVRPDGSRRCRTCKQTQDRNYREAHVK